MRGSHEHLVALMADLGRGHPHQHAWVPLRMRDELHINPLLVRLSERRYWVAVVDYACSCTATMTSEADPKVYTVDLPGGARP